MQMIHKFTWILTQEILILKSLNWQIALRPSRRGWEITNTNPNKTEFIFIGNDQIRNSLKLSFPVSLLGNVMEPAKFVKNFVVILDVDNSIARHVYNLCHACYYQV